ncbi:MAG: hypothetical protein ACKON7_00815, partial [Planctomycetaceae bacterium]
AEFRGFLARRDQVAHRRGNEALALRLGTAAGRATCEVLRTTATWFGATYAEDKAAVQASIAALVAAGEYPADLWG